MDKALYKFSCIVVSAATPYNQYIHDEQTKRQFAKALIEAKRNNRGLWESHRRVMECLERGKQ